MTPLEDLRVFVARQNRPVDSLQGGESDDMAFARAVADFVFEYAERELGKNAFIPSKDWISTKRALNAIHALRHSFCDYTTESHL
jgi:hypothetical protein